jgi:ligand-binding SRPBCC domain-containing protein
MINRASMADHIFESRVWVAAARLDVFAFFADPKSLTLLTPPRLRLRLLSEPAPMAAGSVYDFALSWLGVPVRWRAFIREFDPPYRFVDVQVRGPYARWEHRHRFLEARGATCVEDRVTYRLPAGPIGRLAHALAVGRQLRALWDYRTQRLAALVGPIRPAVED